MNIKYYPEFFKHNGDLNTKNISNRKNIMKKYYKKFSNNQLNLLVLDEQMALELKIKDTCHIFFTSPNRLFVYYKNIKILNMFIKSINTCIKVPKTNLFIKDGGINYNQEMLYYQILLLIMGIDKYQNIIINMIINKQKITKAKKTELLNNSKDDDGSISYNTFYNLKYDYLTPDKLLFNTSLKKNINEIKKAYSSTMEF